MRMSGKGKKLLMQWEGVRTTVYKDSAGLDTIGVGHLITKDELESGKICINRVSVSYASGITNQQVEDLLGQDLVRFEDAVNKDAKTTLNQNQFDALVSFSFNVGVGNFASSTLLKVVNGADYDGKAADDAAGLTKEQRVEAQFLRWNKAGGKVVSGLTNRRQNEVNLWLGNI